MRNGKHVILCVDDDMDMLESTRDILETGGYEVEIASSAEDAIRTYKAVAPDLVIVDLMMEEVDSGVNLVKSMKALGKTPPIYMLSSVGDTLHDSIDCVELGVVGFIQKPSKPKVLLSTIKSQLSR